MITHPVLKGLRRALSEATALATLLEEYKGEPAVFTRRPVPEDAPGRIVIINQTSVTDSDYLASDHPSWQGHLGFYGVKGEPGSDQDDTRKVEEASDLARLLFHRQRFSVQVEGFSVIEVVAGGPFPGPTDDDNEVARIVSLRILLRRN